MNLSKKLKGDPRRDLLVNTFEAYQRIGVEMIGYEQGKKPPRLTSESLFGSKRPDGFFGTAYRRKGWLMKVFEGNMTANEKEFFGEWLKTT
jgi:hypothetical protein